MLYPLSYGRVFELKCLVYCSLLRRDLAAAERPSPMTMSFVALGLVPGVHFPRPRR